MYKNIFSSPLTLANNAPGILVASMFIIAIMSKCSHTENINTFWVTVEYITSSTSAVNCYDSSTILFSERQTK